MVPIRLTDNPSPGIAALATAAAVAVLMDRKFDGGDHLIGWPDYCPAAIAVV